MKKFYKSVDVVSDEKGFLVTLDGKTIKTPAGGLLVLPTKALARVVASEWDAVKDGEEIKPASMGYMQLASTAIDKVLPNIHEVSYNVMTYAMNDLLCYRSGDNPELRAIQDTHWSEWANWAKESANMNLIIGEGIVPINQSPAVKANALLHLAGFDGFKLTVMADLTAIYGSFVLALAVMQKKISILDAYDVSRVDELYQIQQWGVDDMAEETSNEVKKDLMKTSEFLNLI